MILFFERLTDCSQKHLTPASEGDAVGMLSHDQAGKNTAHGTLYPEG